MNLSIPPILFYIASWLAVTTGIWKLFEQAETSLSTDTKVRISRWLRNIEPAGAVVHWPNSFAAVFDSVFGTRHLSWRCFVRSCVVSFASVIIVGLTYAARNPDKILPITPGLLVSTSSLLFIGFVIVLAIILNFIPDYLSLLETRYVIRLMSQRRSTIRFLVLLAVDLVATAAIFCGAFAMLGLGVEMYHYYFAAPLPGAKMVPRPSLSNALWQPIRATPEVVLEEALPFSGSLAVFFYSAFSTSVWVWLYSLSTFAVRLGEYLGLGVSRFRVIFDIDEKPLRSLGFVCNILVTAVYLVVPFLR